MHLKKIQFIPPNISYCETVEPGISTLNPKINIISRLKTNLVQVKLLPKLVKIKKKNREKEV